MFVSGLLRCPVCFISVFFFFLSLMGALSWEGRVDDTLVSKTTHLSIRYVFFSVLCSDWWCPYDEAASPLHYFFHRKKCTFLETGSESSTIPKNLFMHLKRPWTFTLFFFFKSLLRSVWIRHMFSVTQANTHSRISSTVNMLVNENHNFVTALTSQVCWPLPVGELCLYPIVNTK